MKANQRRGNRWLLWLALATAAGAGCSADTIKQNLAIGAACVNPADCGSQPQFNCEKNPGGYCTKDCKNDQDCPSEAICAFAGGAALGGCRKKCNGTNDCRVSLGYQCRPASSDKDSLASHGYCDVPAVAGDASMPVDMSMPPGDAAKGG